MFQKLKTLFLTIFCLTVFYINAQKTYSVGDVPNVHLQDAKQYVSDPEHKIPSKYINALNKKLLMLEDSLAIQCATVVLPKIDEEAKNFAHDLLNKWGVGDKKTDKGLVVLLVYGDGEGSKRDIYMATGYGLEAELTDAFCKYIQINTMVPLLKEGKFGEGLVAGIDEIYKILTDDLLMLELLDKTEYDSDLVEYDDFYSYVLWWFAFGFLIMSGMVINRYLIIKKSTNPFRTFVSITEKENMGGFGCFLFVLFFPLAFLFAIILYYLKHAFVKKSLRCELCGSSNIKFKKSEILLNATPESQGKKRFTFVCNHCHHKHFEDCDLQYYEVSSGGSSGSYSGGSSSSSSSSGGSWGGGSSGGGGAGTSF